MTTQKIDQKKLGNALKALVWDYDIPEEMLLKIFENDEKGLTLTKEDLQVRMLSYYNWHKIIRLIGISGAKALLTPDIIKKVFPSSYQEQLNGVKRILS